MPVRRRFTGNANCSASEAYYSTLVHELTHWTGAEKRLNRPKCKTYGDSLYAMEELIAELSAAFLCAEFKLNLFEKGDHANYIANWLQILKDNKQFIFQAASQANKAVEYLHELRP
jgi:antirestriction protein ArdC